MIGPQPRSTGSLAALVVCILVVTATLGVAGATQASYSISTGDSIDIPQRTVTVEGSDYTITELGRTQEGQDVSVSVDTSDSDYGIYLYVVTSNGVQKQQVKTGLSGDSTVAFPTDNLTPGSYFAAVYDGGIQEIVPIVVSSYDATAAVPASVQRGDTAQVTASVSRTADAGQLTGVEVVVGDSQTAVRVSATETANGYVADVPTDSLPAGDYAAYAVVQGQNETENGEKVLIGVSDHHTLTVTEPTPTPTATSSSSGSTGSTSGSSGSSSGGSSGGSTGGSGSSTPTATATVSPTATPTPTSTATPAPSPTPSPSPQQTPTVTSSPSPTATDDGVTTPASVTPTPSSSPTSGDGPGFGLVAALLALGAVALLARRE